MFHEDKANLERHRPGPELNRNMAHEKENQPNRTEQPCGVTVELHIFFFRVVKICIFSLYNEEIQTSKNWKREQR